MRLFVVNVGANKTDAARWGLRSPIFPDATFEFIPIRERRAFSEVKTIPTYADLSACSGRAASLAAYVPVRCAHYRAHADPEFATFTYGDVLSPRAANLRDIRAEDQIWFLARLWEHDGMRWTSDSDFYFVGLFVVEDNILINSSVEPEDVSTSLQDRIGANAHYRRWVDGHDRAAFRVITGTAAKSFRFRRALRVTPDVAAHLFAGTYDARDDMFRRGEEIVANLNGQPRRFRTFGSNTRSVQAFLDSTIGEHACHLAALASIAVAHRQ